MHYKKWCNSEGYFGKNPMCHVKSFKQVEALALNQDNAWEEHAGVLLGGAVPDATAPAYCTNIDFNKPKSESNTVESNENSASNATLSITVSKY